MKHGKFFGDMVTARVVWIILCITLSAWAQVRKLNYAVIGMKNAEGVTVGEADIIADRLRIELFKTGAVTMMERDQMQEILSEQGFQQSGVCTEEACMVEIGQLLGVERLVSGSIGKLGSMFLLNFRSIDVQTAKILKVVSKDISGGIEDVVKYLPSIARQLVGGAAPGQPVKVPTPVASEPEVAEMEPVAPQPVTITEVEPEEAAAESARKSKNKNRAGVRLSFNWFPGGIKPYLYDRPKNDFVESEYFDSLDDEVESMENEDGYTTDVTKLHIRLQVNFMIKIGPFVVIDIGPGYMFLNQSYSISYNDLLYYSNKDIKFLINSPYISTGVNFVKRFYPLKINVGFLLDINFSVLKYEYIYEDSDFDDDSDISTVVKSNVSFGPRIGVEILGGKHFGFSVDFLYRYTKIANTLDIIPDEGLYDDEEWEFKLPGVGIGTGVNFYF